MYLINKGKNISEQYNLNVLYKENNVYIMDNHLAAIWCWYNSLDLSKKYSLLHIDRHTDLGSRYINEFRKSTQKTSIDIKNIPIEELTKFKILNETKEEVQLFLWDNYIHLFDLLNPDTFDEVYFSVQELNTEKQIEISNCSDGLNNVLKKCQTQQGNKDQNEHWKQNFCDKIFYRENWDLQANLSHWIGDKDDNSKQWIVNLDIDYFFAKKDGDDKKIYQYLTDEYIRLICREIKSKLDTTIAVLTIAMSPECCGDWESSIRVTNIVAEELGLNFKYS